MVHHSFLKGRNFPSRPTHHLLCEAKFNNEVLTTDPVPHNEEPQFEQELAWDLDKTNLKQHRLQRSALKVTVSTVDNHSPVKEPIGYFMLDLRSCSTEKVYKWYRLLHSKYKNSPAVFGSIYLDSDGQELVSNPKIKTGLAMSLSKNDLIPRVYSSDDEDRATLAKTATTAGQTDIKWYTIGPRCLAKENFMLSLRFEEAVKLGSLIPTEQSLCLGEQIGGFHFTCEIFNVSLYSRKFDQLMQIKFTSEEFTFHIKSTVDILRIYFNHVTPLVVKFCFGNVVLAQALIPIEQLLSINDHSLSTPAVLNRSFDLISVESSHNMTDYQSKHIEDKPRVNVSIILRQYHSGRPSTQTTLTATSTTTTALINHSNNQNLRSTYNITESKKNTTDSSNNVASMNLGYPHSMMNAMYSNNQYGDQLKNSTSEEENLKQFNGIFKCEESTQPLKLPNYFKSTDYTLNWHRYCYTIELRSVKNIQGFDNELQLYARYVYPLFGSGAPVMTLPPVSVARHQEVILPHGFCAFEFAASPDELKTRLTEKPLDVEFFDRSQGSVSMDLSIGFATIPLASIFESPVTKATKTSSTLVRRINGCVNVLANQSSTHETKTIGQLVYALQLEDFGMHSVDSASCVVDTTTNEYVNRVVDDSKPPEPSDIRSTREYQVAMELELWRAAEEAKFTAQLKKREQALMATLAEEWHKRDSQREIICRKKLSEYQALEEKLRNILNELATRERQLTAGEAELVRLKQESLREVEVKRKEVNQQSQIQIRDLECQIKLEKKNNEHWKTQVSEWQNKYACLEEENKSLRNKLNSAKLNMQTENKVTNEASTTNHEIAQLTAELAIVRAKLSETECHLVEVERGRTRYRQLWTKSLHELARIKQEADEATRISLAQKEAELEQLRSYYMNVDDKQLTSRGIKETTEDELEQTTKQRELTNETNVASFKPVVSEKMDAQIARLIEERDGLLNTGVYENTDSLIMDLDRQIKFLLERT